MNTTMSSLIFLLGVGCSSSVAGSRPPDMSQREHESAAAQHAQASTAHAAQYDPKAMTDPGDCMQYLGSCWGSNPTEAHREQAEEQRRAAAAHQAAAQALEAAEARACVGVPVADRDVSPFFHRRAIVDVKMLTRERYSGGEGPAVEEDAGATIALLPAEGVTAERLQRTIECHLARNAVLGYDLPEKGFCPLAVKGATANVSSAGNAFAVNIYGDDSEAAAEILRRARALR